METTNAKTSRSTSHSTENVRLPAHTSFHHTDHTKIITSDVLCNRTAYFFESIGTRKYTLELYNACTQSFRALPLSAVLDKRFLCVHGGISPELNTLSDILKVLVMIYSSLFQLLTQLVSTISYRLIATRSLLTMVYCATCCGRTPLQILEMNLLPPTGPSQTRSSRTPLEDVRISLRELQCICVPIAEY